MANNSSYLSQARVNKADEFYTQMCDIENELAHYKDFFSGKIVYSNCDGFKSNFTKFFIENFANFGLKEFFATGFSRDGHGSYLKYDGTKIERGELNGNGDFGSEECVEILKMCDVVCTNPPFSEFGRFIDTIIGNGKKLLVIGNQNAMTNSNIFNLFKTNRLWAGYGFNGDATYFINSHYDDYAKSGNHKDGMIRVSGVMWFTNIDKPDGNKKIKNGKSYDETAYQKYDDFDAINVDKLSDIPDDYYGPIGVPITYLKKHNMDQFDILGMDKDFTDNGRKGRFKLNGDTKYARVIIQRKKSDNELNDMMKEMEERWRKIDAAKYEK